MDNHTNEFISFSDITRFARAYLSSIIFFIAIGIFGSIFYVATTPKIFVAQTQILIDPKIPQLLEQRAAEVNLSLDTAQVESQIAVMQSEKIATMVIDDLNLLSDLEFNRSRSPTMNLRLKDFAVNILETLGLRENPRVRSWLVYIATNFPSTTLEEKPEVLSEFERDRRTMEIFRSSLDVRRVGVSYAIQISFSSPSPLAAAKLANATADAFVREQIESKASAAREGGEWLERRIKELRTQMNNATQVAQEFRAKHDYGFGRNAGAAQTGVDGGPDPALRERVDGPTLEELEVTADTYRKMYESFLQAFTSSVNQQSYPVADARVITAATPPLGPSSPRSKLILAFGALAGAMLGVGFAFVRNTLDRTLRSPQQIREELGLRCLGELPDLSGRWGRFGHNELERSPRSRFSENLRRAKTAISLAADPGPIRCLGVASALPSDGRSSCASNLAMLYTMSGFRTLVIDADIWHSTLSTRLASRTAKRYPTEVTQEVGSIKAQILTIGPDWFDMLPSAVVEANHLLAPERMQVLLHQLRSYQVIIVDLPPLTTGAEELAISSLLDGVVIAVQWGKTPTDLVAELSRSLQASRATVVGVLMTSVRVMSTKRYPRSSARPRHIIRSQQQDS